MFLFFSFYTDFWFDIQFVNIITDIKKSGISARFMIAKEKLERYFVWDIKHILAHALNFFV